jgi:hypothetical protein
MQRTFSIDTLHVGGATEHSHLRDIRGAVMCSGRTSGGGRLPSDKSDGYTCGARAARIAQRVSGNRRTLRVGNPMSSSVRLRSLGEAPGRGFNEAFEAYAKTSHACLGVRAAPRLYAELTRYYLLWMGGLLARIEEAAAVRDGYGVVVTSLLDCVDRYLDAATRWPATPGLNYPGRSIVPAYYAARAAQRVNAQAEPRLVTVTFDEPHAFVIDVLGHAASEAICAHKNVDLRDLPEAPASSSEVEPIKYRSFLHAHQRERLAEARTPPAPPPVTTPPPPPAVAPTPPERSVQDDELIARWTARLANSCIVLERTNTPPDRSGMGSSYFQRERILYLRAYGHYQLVETTISRISYGNINLGGQPSRREWTGTWTIRAFRGRAALALESNTGDVETYAIADRYRGVLGVDGSDRAWTGS